MNVTYGKGSYIQDTTVLRGEIILGDHKLFLKSYQEELTSSYVPLEKIIELRKISDTIELIIKQTSSYSYKVLIRGGPRSIKDLTQEIVSRRGLKKKFLRQIWIEEEG